VCSVDIRNESEGHDTQCMTAQFNSFQPSHICVPVM